MNMDWEAWAAGLFEGEGCITLKKRKTKSGIRLYPIMTLSSTDEDVVRKFHEVVGVGKTTYRKAQKENWKSLWKWQACGLETIKIVSNKIGPYLGKRRTLKLKEALSCEPSLYSWRISGPHCSLPICPSTAGRNWHRKNNVPICQRCLRSESFYYNERRGTKSRDDVVASLQPFLGSHHPVE